MLDKIKFYAHINLLRLKRPVPILLLFIPCLWGLILGGKDLPSLKLLITFFAGACLMRTAGCVYNDWVDRALDRQVQRCASRPLACHLLTPSHARAWLIFLLGISLGLLFTLPPRTYVWGLISGLLLFIYPWMKRITRWPQIIMGMAFTMGLPMGYSCYSEPLSLPLLVLYSSGVWWAVFYDTLYAHQDREEDILAGIKSTTQVLSSHPKLFLIFCLAGWYIGALSYGWLTQTSGAFYGLLTIPLLPTLWAIKTLNLSDPGACLQAFKRSVGIGIFQTLAICSQIP